MSLLACYIDGLHQVWKITNSWLIFSEKKNIPDDILENIVHSDVLEFFIKHFHHYHDFAFAYKKTI